MDDNNFYSQDGQDKYLDQRVFKKMLNGFFIDIGANDGITFSNTYFLEKHRGWNGICVEPHPTAFEKLTHNRKAKLINACIAEVETDSEFMRIEGYGEMLSGLVNKYDDKHVKRIERDMKIHGGTKQNIKVPCLRLDTIIAQNNVTHIDYCSIDTEGGELEILNTVDLAKIEISVISIENNFDEKSIEKFMKASNYRLISKVGADEFYKKKKASWWSFN